MDAQRLEVRLADRRRFFRRTRLAGHAVELDDRPPAEFDLVERAEHARDIDLAASELDEAVRRRVVRLVGRRTLDVLDVKEQQTIVVALNRLHRIAAALLVVRDVELEFHVPRIGRVENTVDRLGRLAQRAHVIVVADADAEIRTAPADLGEQTSEPRVIAGGHRAPFRPRVRDLQIEPAGVADESRVARVLVDDLRVRSRLDRDAAARERDERQMMPGEHVAQLARPTAELLQDVGPDLDAGKAERGDIVDRLELVAIPGDRRVSDFDVGRRGRAGACRSTTDRSAGTAGAAEASPGNLNGSAAPTAAAPKPVTNSRRDGIACPHFIESAVRGPPSSRSSASCCCSASIRCSDINRSAVGRSWSRIAS